MKIVGYRTPDGKEYTIAEAQMWGWIDKDGCPFSDDIEVLTEDALPANVVPLRSLERDIDGKRSGR